MNIEHYLIDGLSIGYNQNQVLHTAYINNETSIVEYLLTVNVAQKLIEWNESQKWNYSLYLEYPTDKFFKNAFLPYMQVGDDIFDSDIIHPEVTKSIKQNDKIRTGRIDLVVCKEKSGFIDFKESLIGIELKGLNPNLDKVVEDIDRLVLPIEMEDDKFENSIQAGYCLHIKKLGGDRRLSTQVVLESAMNRSIKNLENVIKSKVKTSTTKIEVKSEVVSIKSSEDFAKQGNTKDITADEVAEGTKIAFSILIKIERK